MSKQSEFSVFNIESDEIPFVVVVASGSTPGRAAPMLRAVSAALASGTPGWYVYVLETRSGKLYSGITVDVPRRVAQHAGARRGGARSLRGDPPVRLRYAETAETRSAATKRETALKRLTRAEKLRLVDGARGAALPPGAVVDPEALARMFPQLDFGRGARRDEDGDGDGDGDDDASGGSAASSRSTRARE